MNRMATAESHRSWDHCHLLDIDSTCVPCEITSVNLCRSHHELMMLSECWKKRALIPLPPMTVIVNSMTLSYLAMCNNLFWCLNYFGSFPSRISAAAILFLNINHHGECEKHQTRLFAVLLGCLSWDKILPVCGRCWFNKCSSAWRPK